MTVVETQAPVSETFRKLRAGLWNTGHSTAKFTTFVENDLHGKRDASSKNLLYILPNGVHVSIIGHEVRAWVKGNSPAASDKFFGNLEGVPAPTASTKESLFPEELKKTTQGLQQKELKNIMEDRVPLAEPLSPDQQEKVHALMIHLKDALTDNASFPAGEISEAERSFKLPAPPNRGDMQR